MTLQEKKVVELEVVKLEVKTKKLYVEILRQFLKILVGIRGFFGHIEGRYKRFELVWRVIILLFIVMILAVIFK